MSITMSIIKRQLTHTSLYHLMPLNGNRENFEEVPLKGTHIWTSDSKVLKDYAIIIDKAVLESLIDVQSDYFDGCTLLCIGKIETEWQNKNIIYFDELISPIKLSNQLQLIFSQFGEWERMLSDFTSTTKNLDFLINASLEFMNMELFIVDSEYNYIAYTKGFLAHNESWTGLGTRPPLDSVNSLLFDNNFAATFEETQVFVYPSFIKDEVLLCYNIFYQGKYTARLMAQYIGLNPSQGDFTLVQRLGQAITSVYKRYFNSLEDYSDNIQFRNTLKKLISGSVSTVERPKELLVYRNWKQGHNFQMIKFQLSLKNNTGISLEYFCSQIENSFCECCAVKLPEGIFCIRNLTLGDNTSVFLGKLPYFLRENVCKAGISNEFANFFDLRAYSLEADKALTIGENRDNMLWYYHFQDYSFNYIKEQCTLELPLHQIYHPALKLLMEYDEKEQSELYLTLKTFFEEKYNGSHTAEMLCIHRTTFFYRLKKIVALTGIDMDDFDQRAYLMLSFALIASIE
ncbi:helix-turn-helix domain-containing protein [Eubacteriaceae bacterium ES3]|nr:helix-turn-helix domain-containing protein [Eubacteriaceae bacterium ES3]